MCSAKTPCPLYPQKRTLPLRAIVFARGSIQTRAKVHGCYITSHNPYRRNRCCHTIKYCERAQSPRRGLRRALVRRTHSAGVRAFSGLWFALLLPLRPFSLLLLQRRLSPLLQRPFIMEITMLRAAVVPSVLLGCSYWPAYADCEFTTIARRQRTNQRNDIGYDRVPHAMVRHQWRAMPCCTNRNLGLRGRTALRLHFPVVDPAAPARLRFKSASPFNSHMDQVGATNRKDNNEVTNEAHYGGS